MASSTDSGSSTGRAPSNSAPAALLALARALRDAGA